VPVEIDEPVTNSSAEQMVINGSYLFVADAYNGLKVYDAANPANLLLKAENNTPGIAHGLAVDDSLVCIADRYGLFVFQVTTQASCCAGLSGNIDGDPEETVDLGDLTALIDYLFISFTAPECMEEANVDGDLSGTVDLGDLTALIDHLFISFTPPAACL